MARQVPQVAQGPGLLLAVLSAATFGTSGSFASALIDAGWTPGAAVTARVGIAARGAHRPARCSQLRGRWHCSAPQTATSSWLRPDRRRRRCQLCYFNAVARLSVGVALLLEYLGILLVVLWLWAAARAAGRGR